MEVYCANPKRFWLGWSNTSVDFFCVFLPAFEEIKLLISKHEFCVHIVCALINVFHLIVLTRKPMRTSSINIIMAFVAFFDILSLITHINLYVEAKFREFVTCASLDSKVYAFLKILGNMIEFSSRHNATWLNLSIVIIRTLVIRFPLSPGIQKLGKPKKALLVIAIISIPDIPISIMCWICVKIIVDPYNPYNCTEGVLYNLQISDWALRAGKFTAVVNTVECTAGNILTGISCLWKFAKLGAKIVFIGEKPSEEKIASLNSTCEELKNCIEKLQYGGKEENFGDIRTSFNIFCGLTVFTAGDFNECDSKLVEKESECYKTFTSMYKRDGLILNLTAVFTKCWIRLSKPDGTILAHLGIVPYKSSEKLLFATASWFMFISTAMLFILALLFSAAVLQIKRNGYHHSIRNAFFQIVFLCFLLISFQMTAFILMASYGFHDYVIQESTFKCLLGYSSYLALSSASVLMVAMGVAGNIAKDCRLTDEKEPMG